nr:hydrogenobyrinic acid a,c-diamide synthase (glutamine-hydrolyzing) [Candidatus Methanofastidiosa archaeon]
GAVAKGFIEYDKGVDIKGVIFNNIGSEKHLRMLEDSLPEGVVSLGGLPWKENIELKSRHLGLVPAGEVFHSDKYEGILELIEENLDIEGLIEVANGASDLDEAEPTVFGDGELRARIGVAYDNAFNFYYHDNLDMLRSYGAEIEYFSPMRDDMPEVDGLYFGGGYPEVFSEELSKNGRMMKRTLELSNDEMPIYAECGGLMYLCKSVNGLGKGPLRMCGIFDAHVEMTQKLQALSYVVATSKRNNILSKAGHTFRGHEFHYSRITEMGDEEMAYELSYGKGISNGRDGLLSKSTLASYTHLHFASSPKMAEEFVYRCSKYSHR